MNLMDLVVNISANSQKMEQGINKAVKWAESNLANFGAKAQAIYDKIANNFAVKMVIEGTQYNKMLSDYQASFSAFLHSAEAGAKTMQEIVNMSLNSALDAESLSAATETLLRAGVTADEISTKVNQLANISGGDPQKLLSLADAYAACASEGKITEEALASLQSNGFDPLTDIAARNNLSIDAAMQAIADGVVPVQELDSAMASATSESGEYYNSLEESTDTVQGKWSQVKNSLNNLKSVIGQDFDESITKKGIIWLLDKVAGAIQGVTEWADNFELNVDISGIWGKIKGFFTDSFEWSGGALHDALEWVKTAITNIGGWIDNAKTSISNFFADAFADYEDSPIKAAIDAITGAIGTVIGTVETAIAKVKELFGLQGAEDLPEAERNSSGQITPTGALQIMSGTAHATGLYNVPYDGYAAILHRGERVLTRAQADESRKGQKSMQPITVTNNIQTVAESPSETALYIKQAMRSLRFGQ